MILFNLLHSRKVFRLIADVQKVDRERDEDPIIAAETFIIVLVNLPIESKLILDVIRLNGLIGTKGAEHVLGTGVILTGGGTRVNR